MRRTSRPVLFVFLLSTYTPYASFGFFLNNWSSRFHHQLYNETDIITDTYYLWKQNDIYYAARLGDDDIKEENQEELIKAFILAPH